LITCFGYEGKFFSNWANLQTALLILRQSQSQSLGPEDVNQIVLNGQTNRGKVVGEVCQYRGVFPRISHYARLGVKHQRIVQHHLSRSTTWLAITINVSSGSGRILAVLVTSYAKRQKAPADLNPTASALTTQLTNQYSCLRFSYNFSAKPKTDQKRLIEVFSILHDSDINLFSDKVYHFLCPTLQILFSARASFGLGQSFIPRTQFNLIFVES
jgi:hypothetical protein